MRGEEDEDVDKSGRSVVRMRGWFCDEEERGGGEERKERRMGEGEGGRKGKKDIPATKKEERRERICLREWERSDCTTLTEEEQREKSSDFEGCDECERG